MKIFLTGIPGSGKSTVARIFAEKYHFDYIDTDKLIEEKYRMTISEIFNRKGEKIFRKYERKILIDLLKQDNIIISTGGGLPCFFDNMQKMNNSGVTVYLKVSANISAKRIKHEKHRPLLSGLSEKELIKQLNETWSVRKEYYEKAKLIIESNIEPDEIADLIFSYL